MKHPRPPGPRLPGAHWDADRGCWYSQLRVHGHTRTLGRFATAEEAAAAYRAARKERPASPMVRPMVGRPA
jgi:hypothetical protein